MFHGQVRTDLALEAREGLARTGEEIHGIRVEEYDLHKEEIHITKVYVETQNAASIMGKPVGTYVTMETDSLCEPDEGYHREISICLAEELAELIRQISEQSKESQRKPSQYDQSQSKPNSSKACQGKMRSADKSGLSYLVVGLGNREVTADALGPRVLDNLFVTRHMVKLYGKAALEDGTQSIVSCLEPGVMAKTGMETAEIVEGVVEKTEPDCIIVVDALAARSTKRLNRTIQLTNTGIQPGSGVGNHRNALTMENLHVPVIAIGIPTVVDAATIVRDAFGKWMKADKRFSEVDYSELNNMYMTGKDVDEIIKRVSYTVSEGINIAMKRKRAESQREE